MPKKNIRTHSKKKKAFLLAQSNRLEEAYQLYGEICKIDRRDGEAWFMLGTISGKLGKHEEAVNCFNNAIDIQPNHVPSHCSLGIAFKDLGNFEQAAVVFKSALRYQPNHFDSQNNLAYALLMSNHLDEAAIAFQEAIRLQPDNAKLYSNLATIYQVQGLFDKAVTNFHEALRIDPSIKSVHQNMGGALSAQGFIEEAIDIYRKALRRFPHDTVIHSNMLFTLNYLNDHDAKTVYQQHLDWGRNVDRTAVTRPSFSNNRDPDRKLRVGYVSPDLYAHAIADFFGPVLANHDQDAIETFCYAAVENPDDTTRYLRELAVNWRDIINPDDKDLATMIRADAIDVLVDLSGHTAGNRLNVFAGKPAPIQVTYLGYPNTTGLSSIDYRLTDTLADPEGEDEFYSEKLLRLPGCFLCYSRYGECPDSSPLPAKTLETVTFGSFNNLAKINNKVVELWSDLLQAVPDSHLLLKNPSLSGSATCERYYKLFEAQGVSRERVELMGRIPSRAEHLALYSRIDIALDTFPYNGTTTTCEALWMGVPVITLAGDQHAGRVGISLLNAVGYPEWIAETPKRYVSLAVKLADDLDKLSETRITLRKKMAASILCDANAFTRNIETAYRDMWQKWCKTEQ